MKNHNYIFVRLVCLILMILLIISSIWLDKPSFINGLCHLAIPFFLFVNGFYLASREDDKDRKKLYEDFVIKNLKIYLLLSFVYLIIFLFRDNGYSLYKILSYGWQIITFNYSEFTWLFGTIALSAGIIYFLNNQKKVLKALEIAICLYLLGLLFNTYHFALINHNLNSLSEFLINTFHSNINYLFGGFIFFVLGYYLKKYAESLLNKPCYLSILFLCAGLICLGGEIILVNRHLDVVTSYNYYLAYLVIVPSLFMIALQGNIKSKMTIFRDLTVCLYLTYSFVLLGFNLINTYRSYDIIQNKYFIFFIIVVVSIICYLLYELMKKKKLFNEDNLFSFSLLGVSFSLIILSILVLFNHVIWSDEACSLVMMRHSLIDIIKLNVRDVHPPFYYMSLTVFAKTVLKIFPHVNLIVLTKVYSFIPLVVFIIFSLTKIRKDYGLLTACIFALLMVGMPQMMQYFVEIRMYSWALCFTTIAFVYMLDILKKNDRHSWIIFTIFALLSAYSHLYSCLCIVFFFIYLFFYAIVKKDKQFFIKWLIYGGTTFVLYLPWIFAILIQFKKVSGGFWIAPITLNDVRSYFQFIFYTISGDYATSELLYILLIGGIFLLLVRYLFDKDNSKTEKFYAIFGLLVPIIVILVGVVVSLLITPLFISRYIEPSLGCLWFVVAMLIGKNTRLNQMTKYSVLFFVLISFATINYLIRYEIYVDNNKKAFDEYQEVMTDDTLIVSDHSHLQLIEAYFHPNNTIYYYKNFNDSMIRDLYGNIKDNIQIEDIKKYVEEGKKAIFIATDFNVDYAQLFTENDINYTRSGMIHEDWYSMYIYELSSD